MEEMKKILDQMNAVANALSDKKLVDFLEKCDRTVFMSFVGALLDEYEALHADFNTVSALGELLQVSIDIHNMTDEEIEEVANEMREMAKGGE